MHASHPAPYALRISAPIYDNRDAIVGSRSCLADMHYGTIAGAIAGCRGLGDGELHVEIVDVRTHAPVSRAAIDRARGLNPGKWHGFNEKDALPF